MKKGEPQILESREASTMVSNWTEYLCVRQITDGIAQVEICQFEVLGEFAAYDEDGNERDPPDRFDGKYVVGIEDGNLLGGDLLCSDDSSCEYSARTINEAYDWVVEQGFRITPVIRKALKKAVQTIRR